MQSCPFLDEVFSNVKCTIPSNFHFITSGMKCLRLLHAKNKNRPIMRFEKNCTP